MAIQAPSRIRVRFAVAALWAVCVFYAVAHAASPVPDGVSLSESTVTWSTVNYATDAENGFVSGSLDKKTIVDRTFRTHVLENRYLKVTLLPEFGGRILSIIYKPTGHEQLYRTEVGVPYGIEGGNFYYDWLMVYGGIFPTFPDAEHGKTWLKPWDFKVVKESAGEVTVSMSLKDDFAYAAAPRKFRSGSTGIEATYYVTLKADRAALDARVVLKNPRDKTIDYEYWTCTTLAPGSDPKNPKTTGGAEIIAPIQAYSTPPLVGQPGRRRQELGPGPEPLRKPALLQELADDGHRVCGAGYAGREFLGRDQPRQRRGHHPHRRQYGHAGLENVDVGISVVYERNRRTQRPERSAALRRIMGGRVGPVFPQRQVSRTGRSVDSGNLQPDRRHEQRDACEREHPDQFLGRWCERESAVLQYRTGHAVALNVETRRRRIVQRRRGGRPENRKSHFRDDSCQQRRTGAVDDQDRGR
jgi:hypothetical protein